MPILKIKAFQTTDGKSHSTIQEAQIHELAALMESTAGTDIPKFMVAHASEIVDILTMKATSLPKARSINGATKKRKVRSDAGTKVAAVEVTPSAN